MLKKTTKTLILYIAVNNINKAGCARTHEIMYLLEAAEEATKLTCLENVSTSYLTPAEKKFLPSFYSKEEFEIILHVEKAEMEIFTTFKTKS